MVTTPGGPCGTVKFPGSLELTVSQHSNLRRGEPLGGGQKIKGSICCGKTSQTWNFEVWFWMFPGDPPVGRNEEVPSSKKLGSPILQASPPAHRYTSTCAQRRPERSLPPTFLEFLYDHRAGTAMHLHLNKLQSPAGNGKLILHFEKRPKDI